jgi:hypothetical protein
MIKIRSTHIIKAAVIFEFDGCGFIQRPMSPKASLLERYKTTPKAARAP